MKNCENCKREHNGNYGSGRFCSSKCARGYSTKLKRKEINDKVSKKLKGRPLSNNHPAKLLGKFIFTDEQRKVGLMRAIITTKNKAKFIRDASYKLDWCEYIEKYPNKKRIKDRLLHERGSCCETCGISEWNKKPITLQVHHVDGDCKNNEHSNVILLCPNCHTQTDNYGSKNKNKNKNTNLL